MRQIIKPKIREVKCVSSKIPVYIPSTTLAPSTNIAIAAARLKGLISISAQQKKIRLSPSSFLGTTLGC